MSQPVLELQRRDPLLVAGHEEDRQEPDSQRHPGLVKHGARRHRGYSPEQVSPERLPARALDACRETRSTRTVFRASTPTSSRRKSSSWCVSERPIFGGTTTSACRSKSWRPSWRTGRCMRRIGRSDAGANPSPHAHALAPSIRRRRRSSGVHRHCLYYGTYGSEGGRKGQPSRSTRHSPGLVPTGVPREQGKKTLRRATSDVASSADSS